MYQYRLENIWENKTPQVKEEIIDFWISEEALTEQLAHERVNQVLLVARNVDNSIIGINSVYRQHNKQLDNDFYYYRTFIAQRARGSQIVVEMLLETRDYFEIRYIDKRETEAIGILLEVENDDLKMRLNQAIWPGSNFVYIGKNKRGDHVRIYYFKNALIS